MSRRLGMGLVLVALLALILGLYHAARAPLQDPHARLARDVGQAKAVEIDAQFRRGVALLQARHYQHAARAFHRVLALAPDMPEAHVNMGFVMLGMHRHADASHFFRGAIELRPSQVNAYYGLALALEGMQDLPGALGAMRTYVHLSPASDPYRARARAALGRWEAMLNRQAGGSRQGHSQK